MKRSRKQKRKQFEHQKGLCCWCVEPMIWGNGCHNQKLSPTWEHLVPRSMGGPNALANLVLAHRACNSDRGLRTWPSEFQPYSAQT